MTSARSSRELAFIEVTNEAHIHTQAAPPEGVRLFCIAKGKRIEVPRGALEIELSAIPDTLPPTAFYKYESDLELGYLLHALQAYSVTVYTSRKDPSHFTVLNLPVRALDRVESQVVQAVMKELREKFTAVYLISRRGLAPKREKALAQIANLANGIYLSRLDRGLCQPSDLPLTSEIAANLFDDLVRDGILQDSEGVVSYIDVPGSEPTPPVAPRSLAAEVKFVALQAFIKQVLLKPTARPAKEKSAKSTLRNFISNTLISKQQVVDESEKERLTEEVFQRLKDAGVVSVLGTEINYPQSAIEAFVSSEAAQKHICELAESPVARKDVRLTVFASAFETYYARILQRSESAAKSEKGLKEQIKNVVDNVIASSSTQRFGEDTRVSSEEVVELIMKLLLKQKAITLASSGIRYNRAEIDSLGSSLHQTIETASAAFSAKLQREAVAGELVKRIHAQDGVTLGDLHDFCEKLLSVREDGELLAGEIVQEAVEASGSAVALPEEVGSLAAALGQLDLYRNLQVTAALSR